MINEIQPGRLDAGKAGYAHAVEKTTAAIPSKQVRKSIDTVEIGANHISSGLYTKTAGKGSRSKEIEALMEQADKNLAGLRELVQKILLKQREAASRSHGRQRTDLPELMPAEEAAVSLQEDGEFGIKAVSDRIVNFAIAAVGNDPAKLAQMKEAIDKGFQAAEKAFGGKLPEISYATYDEIMRKLDKWSEDMTGA